MHSIKEVKVLRKYVLKVKFENDSIYELDMKPYLYGEVFEPLKDETIFRQVTVDKELGTITWPTGADFCPDYLYQKMEEENKTTVLHR